MDEGKIFQSIVKKNPSGKIISSAQKQMIVNFYMSKMSEEPNIKYKDLMSLISKNLGIGLNRVRMTISEYKKNKFVTSPSRNRIRLNICDKVDDFDKNAIRRKVHQFWLNNEMPTISKVLMAVNEDDLLPNLKREYLRRLLKSLHFKFCKRNRNSILTERKDLVTWRRNYLRSIKKFREEGRPIYYLDETWLDTGDCVNNVWVDEAVTSHRMSRKEGLSTDPSNPTNKGKRLIILHIGSDDGFLPGGLLCFESKKNTNDYHDEMNGETFQDWFEKVLPLLKKHAVVVMDNAPYHSLKTEKVPTTAWKKQSIVDWLISKGENINPSEMVKVDLIEIVQRLKPSFNSYVIDEIAKKDNKTVLRLPPYHCELNPIELVWSMVKDYVKANNTTSKPEDVKHLLNKSLDRVKKEDWVSIINHVKEEEVKFWKIDFIFDELVDSVGPNPDHVLTIENSSDELSDEDDDDVDNI